MRIRRGPRLRKFSRQRCVGAEMAESRCLFCKKSAAEERARVGQIFRRDGVMVHQYCLYFAAGLHQRGEESEGLQGFLLADIRKEVTRASKLTCKFCHQKGAATGCVVKSCRQMCHAPCGIEHGFLFQHHDRFEAFCPHHRPTQKPLLVEAALLKNKKCRICLQEMGRNQSDPFEMLVCPVCETGFHRSCVQKQAWLTGLDFCSCPVCSNKEQFQEEMLRMGVEVPEYDSDSTKEEQCKAETCLCPDGRTFYTRASKYRLKICQRCETPLGHLVCVKGHLCSSCKADCPANDPSSTPSHYEAPPTNSHAHRVGSDKSPPPVECDCLICKAKAQSPPSTHSSPSPSHSSPPFSHSSPPPSLSHPSSLPSLSHSSPLPPSLPLSSPTIPLPTTSPSVPTSFHLPSLSSSLPTSSPPPSPPSISPPSYTMTSTAPSLSASQPIPPHPTSSLLPPSSNRPPCLSSSSTTTTVTSTVTPIPPPKRPLTVSEILQIAQSLPFVPQPSAPHVAEPPVPLSSLMNSPHNAPTTSIGIPQNTRMPLQSPPLPYLSHYPPHLLCSHIHAAFLAAAMARASLPQPSATTPNRLRRILPNPHQFPPRFPLHQPSPRQFFHPHLTQHLRQRLPQLRPRFNPIPMRPAPPPPTSVPPRPHGRTPWPHGGTPRPHGGTPRPHGGTSLVSSVHQPRSAPPSTLHLLREKSQPLSSSSSVCSYFDYVDVPSESPTHEPLPCPPTPQSNKEPSRITECTNTDILQARSSISSGGEKLQPASVDGMNGPSEGEKPPEAGEKCEISLPQHDQIHQKLKRKLTSDDSEVTSFPKKLRISEDFVTNLHLVVKREEQTLVDQEQELLTRIRLLRQQREKLKREKEERNNRLTARYLRSRGLTPKTPSIVLHRVRC